MPARFRDKPEVAFPASGGIITKVSISTGLSTKKIKISMIYLGKDLLSDVVIAQPARNWNTFLGCMTPCTE